MGQICTVLDMGIKEICYCKHCPDWNVTLGVQQRVIYRFVCKLYEDMWS